MIYINRITFTMLIFFLSLTALCLIDPSPTRADAWFCFGAITATIIFWFTVFAVDDFVKLFKPRKNKK